MKLTPLLIIILLLAGYVVYTIDRWKKELPVPAVLVILGIILSFLPAFADVQVTKEILYDYFLPALLFVSAYRFPFKALKANAAIIALLSTFGLLLTVFILGGMIYTIGGWFVSLSLLGALLVASILTPSDPVSVVPILKESSKDDKIVHVVDGESMLNDGTSIVIFTVLSGIYIKDQSFDIMQFSGNFLYVSIGGFFIGTLCGWVVSKAVHLTHHKQYQVMLSIILAYGIFHIAEHFGVSGVLATVAGGLMLSWEFEHTNKTDHFRESLDGFWDIIEPSILSLVFLLIGLVATHYLGFDEWLFASIIFVCSLVARYAAVAIVTRLHPSWRRHLGWGKMGLITWAGIRGTVSIVLVLSLEAEVSAQDDLLVALSFAVILLSLLVQSIGVYPLSKLLGK